MIEKQVEKAVLEAVAALPMDGLDMDGIWQKSPNGRAKGSEDPNAKAFLRVIAAPRSFETFSSPRVDITVALALSVRLETAPTGEEIAAYSEPLFALLQGWQMSIETVRNDFTFPAFTPCGIRLDGGDIGFSGEPRNCWNVTQKFTLRGIIKKG